MADEKARLTPPTLPWKTFSGYVESLAKAKVTPRRIDTSMMSSSMSGQTRGALKAALRFLRLIDEQGIVSNTFGTLIDAHGTNSWAAALGKVIEAAYAPVVDGLDLRHSTPGELNEKFTAAGVEGEPKFKAVRFYLAALTASKIEFSPFFNQRGARSIGRKRFRKTEKTTPATGIDEFGEQVDDPPLPGLTRWPIPIPGKSNAIVTVPDDIVLDDWVLVDSVVRLYIDRLAKLSQA